MAAPTTSPEAGSLPDESSLIDVDRVVEAYYQDQPDPGVDEQRVSFGTSGHRGRSLAATYNEAHVLAIGRPRESTGRCSWAAIRICCRSPPSARSSRCWPPTGPT